MLIVTAARRQAIEAQLRATCVRVYGDPAGLLCEHGLGEGAQVLQRPWCRLAHQFRFQLLPGIPAWAVEAAHRERHFQALGVRASRELRIALASERDVEAAVICVNPDLERAARTRFDIQQRLREALVRRQPPGEPMISPAHFVPVAEETGQHVIAEGIETEAQLAFLERNGCHAVQG